MGGVVSDCLSSVAPNKRVYVNSGVNLSSNRFLVISFFSF